ncbi:MAG TPA: hypothetical protein VG318_10625 [Actinomycetota bacterium]|nr:hypothetical protein [Actinomycetota bacterium]
MTPRDLALLVAQLAAFGLVGWATGSLLLRWARIGDLALPERGVAAVVGFAFFGVAAMLGNVVTGGRVFGNAFGVPVLGLAVVGAWAARGAARSDWEHLRRPRRWALPLLLLGALAFLYLLPVLLAGSGVRTGDPPWHLGWTAQLLGGERVPVGPAAEYARNAYPWGYHALLASLVRLVPSSTALLAHEGVHVVLMVSIPLVAACLARRVDRGAGLAAAACTSLVGGFGWVIARSASFEPSPREAAYGADLVAASPNSVYELLPPALPREVGLVLAGAAAVFLLLAIESGTRRSRVLAGAITGVVGVVSVPMLFTALLWAAGASVFVRGSRLAMLRDVCVPALGVFALWAAPVAVGYVNQGGFVDITPRLGMEWPLPTALGAYGLLLPLAVAGALVAWRHGRPLLVLAGSSAVLLGLAVARDVFDWTVWSNATLLHQGRMWPPVHLVAGALGGLAVVRAASWLRDRSRGLAVGAGAVALAVAAASPVLASLRMRVILEEHLAGYVYGEDFAPGSFAREAARVLGPDDVVAGGTDEIRWALFQMSGVRLAEYDDPRFEGNDLRIRYAELARRWDEAVADGGFTPTHVVVPAFMGAHVGPVVARGRFGGETWLLTEAG